MRKEFFRSSFLIVGVARDCEKVLSREVNKINSAFSEAKSVEWLIIESDSNDKTVEALVSLKQKFSLNYVALGKLSKKYPRRTERIAFCRNKYLKKIRANRKYDYIDFVVVADLDGVNSQLTSESVKSCWDLKVNWDACFANQSAPYYDIWALRHDLWSPNDCFQQESFFRQFDADEFKNRFQSVFSRMIQIPRGNDPIKVDSAFGGLGIYKKKLLSNSKYIGINKSNAEVCEHVQFHIDYMANANLYIVPSLINSGWNKHSYKRSKLFLVLFYIATRFFKIIKLKLIVNKIKKPFKDHE